MIKREAGFLGLAKQNAKRKGMIQVPKRYQPEGGGPEEYPAFLNQQEMALLTQHGGSGKMTPFGIPSFKRTRKTGVKTVKGYAEGGGASHGGHGSSEGAVQSSANIRRNSVSGSGASAVTVPTGRDAYTGGAKTTTKSDTTGDWGSGGSYERKQREAEAKKRADAAAKKKAEAAAKKAAEEKKKKEAYEADRKEDYEKKQARETKRQGFLDEYTGFQGEAAGLGKESKKLTEGQFTDSQGRVEGDPGFNPDDPEGSVQGGFAGDVKKLGAYEGKFDDLATEAGTRGEKGEDYFQGAVDPVTGERVGGAASDYKGAGTTGGAGLKALGTGVLTDSEGRVEGDEGFVKEGATMQGGYKQITGKGTSAATDIGSAKARELAGGVMTDASGKKEGEAGYDASTAEMKGGYEQITGDKSVAQAGKGATDLRTGATSVGDVQSQFGKEGFQKDIRGMSEKALSGDVGQREAAMLKGRMEEGRMASQKGSEEKLRREMAQSGASPAEIASKVAQFQRQSASQQAQAGRSETLSSQLQGQQLGQAQLAQAAGLKGQEAGLAGKQAGLAVTQAELRGKAAGMEMAGTEAEQKAKLASLAGRSQQNVTATEMDVTGATAEQKAKLASLGGQGKMLEAGTGMEMEAIKGAGDMYGKGVKIGMAGADQEAGMLTSAAGAVEAAGDARTKQMGGLDQQGGFIDQQGNYVQAKLASTESDITQASTEEQARLTREAQGTPDAPRYRPPPSEIEGAVDTATGLPTGTTIAPVDPQLPTGIPPKEEIVPMAGGGPVQGGRPYLVGEKGRELFTPSQSGNITPNSQLPPPPTEVKQTGDHSFTIAQGDASASAPQGGINAAPPPQLQGAPPPADAPQAPPPSWLAKAQRQEFDRRNEELQQGSASQPVQGGLSPMQQGGMASGVMGQPSQGNQQQGMRQQQQELTKQMGQAGQVRPSWRDGGGLSGFGQGGSIAQQGGLMGQNAPMNPNQQQDMEAFHKKRQQMQMQGFGMR